MNTRRCLLTFIGSLPVALGLLAAEAPSLDPHLEPLRPWLGKTWKGEFKNSTPDKPTVDIARWERALNGKAVRVLHSINDGVYGGESIVTWDEKKQAVTYHYFTTAGFMTIGTMTFKDGKVLTLVSIHAGILAEKADEPTRFLLRFLARYEALVSGNTRSPCFGPKIVVAIPPKPVNVSPVC